MILSQKSGRTTHLASILLNPGIAQRGCQMREYSRFEDADRNLSNLDTHMSNHSNNCCLTCHQPSLGAFSPSPLSGFASVDPS
jgi:hypothetical protein